MYCVLLRPDIEALLAGPQKVVPNEAFFRLLVAVHQLDNLAIQWCGGKIGQLPHPTPIPSMLSSTQSTLCSLSSLICNHPQLPPSLCFLTPLLTSPCRNSTLQEDVNAALRKLGLPEQMIPSMAVGVQAGGRPLQGRVGAPCCCL